MTTTVESEPTAARQENIVSLPDVPADMYGNGKEYQQARAWEVIWDWCLKHGLANHTYEHRDQYDKLNGPQMIAQWIIDMKSALFFFEKALAPEVDGWIDIDRDPPPEGVKVRVRAGRLGDVVAVRRGQDILVGVPSEWCGEKVTHWRPIKSN